MPIVSIVIGLCLIAVAAWGKFTTDTTSITAWIPAFFGGPLVLCGLLALRESLLKHAMHAAAMVGVLGFLGGVANIIRVVKNNGSLTDTPGICTLLMTGLCLLFVVLCINSFIQVRRRRAAEAGARPTGP